MGCGCTPEVIVDMGPNLKQNSIPQVAIENNEQSKQQEQINNDNKNEQNKIMIKNQFTNKYKK